MKFLERNAAPIRLFVIAWSWAAVLDLAVLFPLCELAGVTGFWWGFGRSMVMTGVVKRIVRWGGGLVWVGS